MKRTTFSVHRVTCAFALGLLGCSNPVGGVATTNAALTADGFDNHSENFGTYNLHLVDIVRFNALQPGSDPVHGQALFGLASDGQNEDKSAAIFAGPSQVARETIVSNTRTCFTCHRGPSARFGLPKPPLTASIPLTDALFTGITADAGIDPDAMHNLDQLGLVRYRVNRFNPQLDESDPFRQVFGWRKSIPLVNVGLAHGFLNDGRGRVMFETDRGAVFSHTQTTDDRFDDLFPVADGNDMEAFQVALLSDPRLAALRDPSSPMYQTLVNDPFYTVNVQTDAQKRGEVVFKTACMTCHNTPNVFNNVSNLEPLGNGDRPVTVPSFAPASARLFNIGVAERNRFGLRFSRPMPDGSLEPIVVPLANEDGSTDWHVVTSDLGLAMTTARSADVGRFKVPQLRGVKDAAPYFHDNSAATLEEVVDYFNSDDYNRSRDGQRHPIHLTMEQRADLLEFLRVL